MAVSCKRESDKGRAWGVQAARVAFPVVFLVLCLLGLGACGGGSVHLDSSDNGKTVSVQKGDEVVITLDENPTTGYVWAIDKTDDQILALKSSDYSGSGLPVAGAGGTRTFTFTTKHTGTATLALKDWRSWEGDKSTVGRFSVAIQVT